MLVQLIRVLDFEFHPPFITKARVYVPTTQTAQLYAWAQLCALSADRRRSEKSRRAFPLCSIVVVFVERYNETNT